MGELTRELRKFMSDDFTLGVRFREGHEGADGMTQKEDVETSFEARNGRRVTIEETPDGDFAVYGLTLFQAQEVAVMLS